MTAWYVDSSSLLKLLVAEDRSAATRALLVDDTIVTSAVTRVEIVRALRRLEVEDPGHVAHPVLARLSTVPVTAGILDRAAALPQPHLRTLDALHVASAQVVIDAVRGVVAHDDRLLDAARSAGLPTHTPGVDDPGALVH